MQITVTLLRVAREIIVHPKKPHYAYGLAKSLGVDESSTLRALTSMEQAGWAESNWERGQGHLTNKPPRRVYRLTADGLSAALGQLAALQLPAGTVAVSS